MDARLSEEQALLRETARDFLERECPMSLVRAQMEDAIGLPESLWKQMAELGWLGLVIDEAYGGSGLGAVELAIVLDEMGRVLCPGPFLSTAVVGALAIGWAGSEEQRQRLLPEIARGELRMGFAQLESDPSWGPEAIATSATIDGPDCRVTGHKLFVHDAPSADLMLVVARAAGAPRSMADGVGLYLVDPADPGVQVRSIAYNEQTRKLGEVRLDGARAEGVGSPVAGWPVIARLHAFARAAVCAELAGSSRRVLELAVDYAKQREQFGQPIGRFQALAHKCADMLVRAEGTRSAAYYAAWALDAGEPDAHTTACLAKAYCGETAAAVAGDGIQIHGGLGFTWEQDLHLYYKHARASELAWGAPAECRELAARVLIDGAESPDEPGPRPGSEAERAASGAVREPGWQ